MLSDIQRARILRPLQDAIRSLDQVVSDAILLSEHEAYRNALGGYALLKAAMRFVPGLAALVERLRSLFDRKRRPAADAAEPVKAGG